MRSSVRLIGMTLVFAVMSLSQPSGAGGEDETSEDHNYR